jgi:ketosteroid isomerase-like protein
MKTRTIGGLLAGIFLLGCAVTQPPADAGALREQVLVTERAFARTMADRDAARFATFLSSEAVFVSGKTATRGSANIAALWARHFTNPAAPFSWYPDQVEVLASGTLAYSSGPVLDPQSRPIGRFSSIWRLEGPGVWRIVFDSGSDTCDSAGR